MFSFELLLVMGVIGFYLYDSSMLLYVNEVVFVRARQHWEIHSPGDNWVFLRRRLYIPNPLTPHIALFRSHWLESDAKKEGINESLEVFIDTLIPFQYLLLVLLILFFAGLPFVALVYGSGPMLLWVFGIIYFNILSLLVLLYRKKEPLGVSNKKFLILAFESLACAPFALNIVRKITLNCSLNGDAIMFAKQTFDHETFLHLIAIVLNQIEEQLNLLDKDDPRYISLQSYKEKINGMK